MTERLHPYVIITILEMVQRAMEMSVRADYLPYSERIYAYSAAFDELDYATMLMPATVRKDISECLSNTLADGSMHVEKAFTRAQQECNKIMKTYEQYVSRTQKERKCSETLRDYLKTALNCVTAALHKHKLLTLTAQDLRVLELISGEEE